MEPTKASDISNRLIYDLNYPGQIRLKLKPTLEKDGDKVIESIACEIIPKNGGIFATLKSFVLSIFSNYWKAIPLDDGSKIYVNINSVVNHTLIKPDDFSASTSPLRDIDTAFLRNVVNIAEAERKEKSMIPVNLGAEYQERLAPFSKYTDFPCKVRIAIGDSRVVIFGPDGCNSFLRNESHASSATYIRAELHRNDENHELFLKIDPKDSSWVEIITRITNK